MTPYEPPGCRIKPARPHHPRHRPGHAQLRLDTGRGLVNALGIGLPQGQAPGVVEQFCGWVSFGRVRQSEPGATGRHRASTVLWTCPSWDHRARWRLIIAAMTKRWNCATGGSLRSVPIALWTPFRCTRPSPSSRCWSGRRIGLLRSIRRLLGGCSPGTVGGKPLLGWHRRGARQLRPTRPLRSTGCPIGAEIKKRHFEQVRFSCAISMDYNPSNAER